MLRDLERRDLLVLDDIHQNCHSFPVPNLIKHILDDKIVEDDKGEVLGYGLIKLFPEAIMVLDTRKPLRQRVAALNELLQYAIQASKNNNVGQLHIFVEDDKFAHLLIERYGFNTVNAKALVLNLEQ